MLQLERVDKYFGEARVLNQVDLAVPRGQIVGLLGPSGAGKTTLLRLIAGLTAPDAGRVMVTAGARLGYVFQEPRLLPWRTTLDNVALAIQAANLPEPQPTAREWLARVGLDRVTGYYPAQLSGGMRQRVALARAFATRPDLLLLDEPFSGLDDPRKDDLLDILAKAARQDGMTVLYVTHARAEVERLADRLLLLDPTLGRPVPLV